MDLASAIDRVRPVSLPEKNVGGRERLVRGLLGPPLVVIGVAGLMSVISLAMGPLGVILSLVVLVAGLRMSITAKTQKCYMNERIGRNTYRPK